MPTDLETTEATGTEAPVSSSTKNLSVDTRTYRSYGIVVEGVTPDKNEFKALGPKDKDGAQKTLEGPLYRQQTADNKAWTSAEEAGNTKLSENNFVFYTVESEEGFTELIPDAAQRLYIIQRGVTSIQTSKANQLQAELTEDGTAFKYDGDTIDLRDELNAPPKRTKLNETQKIMRDLSVLDPTKLDEIMAQLMAMKASAQAGA